jgi:hypothetical protein
MKKLENKRIEIKEKRNTSMPSQIKNKYQPKVKLMIIEKTQCKNVSISNIEKKKTHKKALSQTDNKQILEVIQKKENLKKILGEMIKVNIIKNNTSRFSSNKTSSSYDNIKSSPMRKTFN